MIQGFVLFAVISSDVLLRYKIRLVRAAPQPAGSPGEFA
jgi:hypothetical protein